MLLKLCPYAITSYIKKKKKNCIKLYYGWYAGFYTEVVKQ